MDELASILRIGRRTIERALADGTFPIAPLPGVGNGRHRRRRLWSRAAIERWVNSARSGR